MILFPPAKVNIGLNVLGKLEDGFHEIETIMIPIPLTDILEILPSDSFEMKLSGINVEGEVDDNLCTRAFNEMAKEYDIPPVRIHLIKNIPTGAGLGGGSSDASSVLLGLNSLFNLNCTNEHLSAIASRLGSDCAFFINDGAQIARGKGEKLTPIMLDLENFWIKLINPGIHISTQEAYGNVSVKEERNLEMLIKKPIENWKNEIRNAFEPSIIERFPEIDEIKQKMYAEGADYASMSGSGSTVYALYQEKPTIDPDNKDQWVFKLNA